MPLTTTLRAALAALAILAAAPPAAAQNPFEAVATVNGTAITRFEAEQRARFLGILRVPDASFAAARDALIDETLQIEAARRAGIEITAEELDAGMAEFAQRGGLEPDAFLALLGQAGVAPEVFRNFVRNGLLWRGYVQARFGETSRPTETEVRQAARRDDPAARLQVLISEIAIPYDPASRDQAFALAQRLSDTLRGADAFAAAARQFSRAPTAPAGGRLPEPLPLARLAPQMAQQLLTLEPGGVTDPIDLGTFVGVFLLRRLDQGGAPADTGPVEYAVVSVPGPREAALARTAQLQAETDTCDDLYGTAGGLTLARETAALGAIAPDLRGALAGLDANEATVLTGAGDGLRFVVLCARGAAEEPTPDALEQIGRTILSRRLGTLADGALEALRADAVIRR